MRVVGCWVGGRDECRRLSWYHCVALLFFQFFLSPRQIINLRDLIPLKKSFDEFTDAYIVTVLDGL